MSNHWQRKKFQGDDGICFEEYGVAEHDRHATLRYNDIASEGPPARPLDFPAPEVFRGERIDLRARDHKSGTIHHLKNVLLRSSKNSKYYKNRSKCDTAYLMTKKISKTVYGSVNLCIVLKRINKTAKTNHRNDYIQKAEDRQDDEDYPSIEWESTDYQAAIKISEWKKIHALRGKHLEDPIKEIAAMQLFGNNHSHVVGALEVLQDDKCLYTVMPYLGGGDLYGRLIEFMGSRSIKSHSNIGDMPTGFDEDSARIWFRQLLQAVDHLQKKGVCHRDICLENILLDKNDNICLIDPGMSLRCPYTDIETGGVGDVSAGTSRRLIIAQGQGGKLMYAAPEIIAKETQIDAFATDLWSLGVVLFIMVVGYAPFRWAHPTDKRYSSISSGGLKNVVKGLGLSISPEVCDLLQGFFWADNQKRFTLAEVIRHPWVQGRQLMYAPLTLPSTPTIPLDSSRGFRAPNHKNKILGKKGSLNGPYRSHRPSSKTKSDGHPSTTIRNIELHR